MAGNRIRGITVEIGGDTTKLQKALQGVDKDLRATQSSLKDVNKLLKFDPKNTELLTQKQKALEKAIDLTKERLAKLKDAQAGVQKGTAEWDALQREIIETEQNLQKLEKEYKAFGSVSVQQIKETGKQMQAAGQKVSDFGQKLAPVSAAAAAVGGALVKLGYDAVTGADDLNTLAKQTGLTTAEIQKMQYAADLIDVSFEDIAGALRKMKANMDGHPETWERLGVSVRNADGSMRNANDVFYDAVKALSTVENGTERDQLAMDLFGKSADSLAGIIDDGGAALEEFGGKAEEAGLILEQDTLDALNKTNDTIDELKANFSATAGAIGADVATAIAPALDQIAKKVEGITAALRDLSPEQTAAILAIAGVAAVIAPVIIVIGQFITAVGAITTALAPVIAGIAAFAAAFGGPVLAIAAAIAAFVLFVKNMDKVEESTQKFADRVGEKWRRMKESLGQTVDGIKQNISQKWEQIRASVGNTVENLRQNTGQKFSTLRQNLSSTAESIRQTLRSKFDAAKKAITDPIESAKKKVSDAIAKIKSTVNNVKLSLPHFKLPHFRISGGTPPWGIGGMGTKPTISVDWYKKAYQDPIIFTQPTVLQTAGGLKGFGDGAGAEIVMGLNKLRELVGAGTVTNNISVYAAPGMDVRQLADAVAERIQFQTMQSRAVFA